MGLSASNLFTPRRASDSPQAHYVTRVPPIATDVSNNTETTLGMVGLFIVLCIEVYDRLMVFCETKRNETNAKCMPITEESPIFGEMKISLTFQELCTLDLIALPLNLFIGILFGDKLEIRKMPR